jgi:hypothetical protein
LGVGDIYNLTSSCGPPPADLRKRIPIPMPTPEESIPLSIPQVSKGTLCWMRAVRFNYCETSWRCFGAAAITLEPHIWSKSPSPPSFRGIATSLILPPTPQKINNLIFYKTFYIILIRTRTTYNKNRILNVVLTIILLEKLGSVK